MATWWIGRFLAARPACRTLPGGTERLVNAYWYVPRNRLGTIAEIWLLPSQYMRVCPDRQHYISGYLFRHGGLEERFGTREIIHLKYPSPESVFYGKGPLQAAASSVDAHESMKESERRSFENGVFPGLAIQTGEKLSSDVRRRLEETLRRGFSGPQRSGRALILEQGLAVRPFTFSPREMDFLKSSKMTRDEILALFGVPAAVAGISEDVNRSSAEAMLYTFAENTILPKLKLLQAQLTQDLCSHFDTRIEARFDSPLPRQKAEDRADMIARIRHGITTVNEERERLGLAPLAQTESPLLPSSNSAALPGQNYSSGLKSLNLKKTVAAVLAGQRRRLLAAIVNEGLDLKDAAARLLSDPEEARRLL
ncbi:MAG: phage portal protein, partial [Planctomycetes bacterium]|nr:phage portal protein [Planctomycetota bacterium]